LDTVGTAIHTVEQLLGGLVAVTRPKRVAARALDSADADTLVGLVIGLHASTPINLHIVYAQNISKSITINLYKSNTYNAVYNSI